LGKSIKRTGSNNMIILVFTRNLELMTNDRSQSQHYAYERIAVASCPGKSSLTKNLELTPDDCFSEEVHCFL